jgi:two-component system response regulator YesN
MLRILIKEENRNFKTIILSAYSEFDYAKQAISFGVCEYLLKPIDLKEFDRAMRKVIGDVQAKPDIEDYGSLEQIIASLLSERIVVDQRLSAYLKKTHGIGAEDCIGLICVYLGGRFDEDIGRFSAALQKALAMSGHLHITVPLPQAKEFVIAIHHCNDFVRLQQLLTNNMNSGTVMAFTATATLNQLSQALQELQNLLPWHLTLAKKTLITPSCISNIKTTPLDYPKKIERLSTAALIALNKNELITNTADFLKTVAYHFYDPSTIKKAVLRYLLSLLRVAKEINYAASENVDEIKLAEEIDKAVTLKELEEIVFGTIDLIFADGKKPEGIVILRAKRLVAEYYHKGIMLEELAEKMNLTPEYISAQFVKELGVSFSVYIRQFRIQKAKELLINSDLKLYEIAEKIGYSSAKYFSKVFRETEGMLPTDYRTSFRNG